ncbi:hypothetical protein H6G76_03460 [Nostoc sp. FACHB-152]|uniref:hypothetical protein n=1 Tax=unclassified Nostoc TaxID=2593658 RepID=UPI0016882B9D|nr:MULTISPECIES: hypothetical protein [unclassified Nostoc]MBD2446229.1 hypothetical protein [Nostoc sp. FACHB-152]MBD2469499.1 hypothetical protein [Nostoc sp. FACHB-145]
MTIAPQNTVSLTISMDNSQSVNQDLWRPVRLVKISLQRLWWHTKGYGIVFSIMLLTLMSLIFVSIHWSSRKLLIVPTQQDELDLESSK